MHSSRQSSMHVLALGLTVASYATHRVNARYHRTHKQVWSYGVLVDARVDPHI